LARVDDVGAGTARATDDAPSEKAAGGGETAKAAVPQVDIVTGEPVVAKLDVESKADALVKAPDVQKDTDDGQDSAKEDDGDRHRANRDDDSDGRREVEKDDDGGARAERHHDALAADLDVAPDHDAGHDGGDAGGGGDDSIDDVPDDDGGGGDAGSGDDGG